MTRTKIKEESRGYLSRKNNRPSNSSPSCVLNNNRKTVVMNEWKTIALDT